MARRLPMALLALLLMAGAGLAGQRLEQIPEARRADSELLYLPNGKHLELASLGHSALAADLIYLWAIQYYSNYERADRHRYVEHVFSNVITELDPHYIDPYWLGALILTVEAGDLEAGLRLLEKGFRNNPNQWILPYLAAWECYRAKDYPRAAHYFDLAAQVPNAPPRLLRMRAGMFSRAGDAREGLAEWREVLADPRSDAATIAIAERQVRDLEVRAVQEELDRAIARFREENGRSPRGLEELAARHYISSVPRDPDGGAYRFDARTGRVSSSSARVLRSP